MQPSDGGAPTHPLQPAADASRTDREASLDALRTLEAALSAPTPGREDAWLGTVVAALDALAEALDSQAIGDAETASLLSEVAGDHPRLLPRIERLRHEHRDLREVVASLRRQIVPASGLDVDTADIRDRLASVGRRLRQHRAREADLVYEAVNINLGVGD
jgi:hemerythrin HHE cation binding domain-containing protein